MLRKNSIFSLAWGYLHGSLCLDHSLKFQEKSRVGKVILVCFLLGKSRNFGGLLLGNKMIGLKSCWIWLVVGNWSTILCQWLKANSPLPTDSFEFRNGGVWMKFSLSLLSSASENTLYYTLCSLSYLFHSKLYFWNLSMLLWKDLAYSFCPLHNIPSCAFTIFNSPIFYRWKPRLFPILGHKPNFPQNL